MTDNSDFWTMTVRYLMGKPMPALPPLPGRVFKQVMGVHADPFAERWNEEHPDRAEPVECHQPRGRKRKPTKETTPMDNATPEQTAVLEAHSSALVTAAHDLYQRVFDALDPRGQEALALAALAGATPAVTIKWASDRRAEVRLGIVDPNTDEPQTFFALDFERPAFAQ